MAGWFAVAKAGSDVLKSGLGMLGTYLSNEQSYHNSGKLMEKQALLNYIYGKKTALESPGWNRQGLEDAGYNPMLAVQNATSGVNSSWSGLNNSTVQDYGASIRDAQRVQNETAQTNSVVHLQDEQASTEVAKRRNLEFQNAMLDVEKHLKQKDLDSYDKRFYTEMYRMMQEAEKYRQEASVVGYNAESARIAANASKTQADTSAKWTPVGIGAGLGAGALGFVLGKVPGLKYLKKSKVGFSVK